MWVVLPGTRVLRGLPRRLLPISGALFYLGCWNDSLRRVVFFKCRENLMVPRSTPPDLMTTTGVHLGSDIPQSLQVREGPDLTPHFIQPICQAPFQQLARLFTQLLSLSSSASSVARWPNQSKSQLCHPHVALWGLQPSLTFSASVLAT